MANHEVGEVKTGDGIEIVDDIEVVDDLRIVEDFAQDANSIGGLHGSAKGNRNVEKRLAAMARVADLGGERLLDIGCGTGEYTRALATMYDRVDGIEIEQTRLELFQEDTPDNVELQLMSANEMSYDDDTFDTVVMIEVLEHLSDVPSALREVARVLKPHGRLVLTTPSRRWPLEQHGVLFRGKRYKSIFAPGLVWVKPLHRRLSDADAFEPSDLRRLADQSGLVLEGHTFMMPPLDSLAEGHRVHQVTDQAENYIKDVFGQTIVASLKLAN